MGNSCTHHRFDEKPKLKRIEGVTSIVIAILLFIVVLLYAGFRGYNAYNHDPATQENFIKVNSIVFPAITVCPLVNVPIAPLECMREISNQEVEDCLSTVYTRTYNIEGTDHLCLTFNDPQSSSGSVMSASSVNDELAVIVYINSTAVPPGEQIGAIVFVHPQGSDPELEVEETFITETGVVTEVWLQQNHRIYANKSEEYDYLVRSYAGVLKPEPGEDVLTIVDMDFVYPRIEILQHREYFVYSVDVWIGEVGGVAFLLFFLHKSFLFLAMSVASKVVKDDSRSFSKSTTID